jgi:hypothetical protein
VFPDITDGLVLYLSANNASVACEHVVVDGLRFPNCATIQTAPIVIGRAYAATRYVNHITIRNCYFSLGPTADGTTHCIAMIATPSDVTIEDCEFVGTGISGKGGSGIVAYGTPTATATLVQRCTFKDFDYRPALQLWDEGVPVVATIEVKHCTFLGNGGIDLDLRAHSTALVQDCAWERADTTSAIYDPTYSASTTRDHLFFSQTFQSGTYLLAAGQTGRGAATDGTDAGALDW